MSVPDKLRADLLGEEYEEEEEAEKVPLLSSLCEEHRKSVEKYEEEDDIKLVGEIKQVFQELKMERANIEARVVDGSYTVTNYFEDEGVVVNSDNNTGDEEEGGGAQKKRKPKVDTVYNVSAVSRILNTIKKVVRTGSCKSVKKRSETKAILEGVNLRFQPGKQYLVLGAPGSGKSTLLKLIANTLQQNRNKVVGGEVTINGISPTDKDIFWSVRLCVCVRCIIYGIE